jgi:hypothetical protein
MSWTGGVDGVLREKFANTRVATVISSTQSPEPEHAPLHPSKTESRDGSALRWARAPAMSSTSQS